MLRRRVSFPHHLWRPLAPAFFGLVVAACSGEPNDVRLQPPEGWRDAVRGQSQAAADRARQASEDLLRRSPAAVAPGLAQGIRFSRRQALREDVRDIPPNIRTVLEPYFDEEILAATRWTLAGQDLGAGSLLARWYYEEGAVTLNDVIVFSGEDVARNVWLWAHELAHVEQYRRYGVDGFARRYAEDWRALETEASQRAFAITADIRARRAARPTPVSAIVERVEEMLSPGDPPAEEDTLDPPHGHPEDQPPSPAPAADQP